MKKLLIVSVLIGCMFAANVAQAGHREWSTAGKILAGVVIGYAIGQSSQPVYCPPPVCYPPPPVVYYPPPVIYYPQPPVIYYPPYNQRVVRYAPEPPRDYHRESREQPRERSREQPREQPREQRRESRDRRH